VRASGRCRTREIDARNAFNETAWLNLAADWTKLAEAIEDDNDSTGFRSVAADPLAPAMTLGAAGPLLYLRRGTAQADVSSTVRRAGPGIGTVVLKDSYYGLPVSSPQSPAGRRRPQFPSSRWGRFPEWCSAPIKGTGSNEARWLFDIGTFRAEAGLDLMNSTTQTSNDAPLDKVRRHIRILTDLGRLLGENVDLERFLNQAVVQIARAVEIHHVKVLRYRPETSSLLLVAGVGWKEGVIHTASFSTDLRSPPGRAFQTAEAVSITEFGKQEEYVRSDFLKEHGIVSVSNVPILIEGAAWGVLEVDSTRPRNFSEDTTEFLTAAAAFMGIALRRHTGPDEQDRLLTALAEAQKREILLREMQHRVKNNFQLVLSSISIQKSRYKTPEIHQALDHVASRINAISLAHDQLTPRQDGGQVVRLSHYVRALCSAINKQADEVALDVECNELALPIERALPVGLILNEAAMNSIKHAFTSEGGRIKVSLIGGVGYGEARLSVSDNGRGMQTGKGNGSGLKLMASLARQIGGIIEQESDQNGTKTTLTFPLVL
jgi:two-component sensor histidine kinase